MMARGFLLWLLLAGFLGGAVYKLKYEVGALDDQLNRINRQIVADQEAIAVLKAEWSYVNKPQVLEELVRKFMPDMQPMTNKQFTEIAALPMRGQSRPPVPQPAPEPPGRPVYDDEEPTSGAPDGVDTTDEGVTPLVLDGRQQMLLVRVPRNRTAPGGSVR